MLALKESSLLSIFMNDCYEFGCDKAFFKTVLHQTNQAYICESVSLEIAVYAPYLILVKIWNVVVQCSLFVSQLKFLMLYSHFQSDVWRGVSVVSLTLFLCILCVFCLCVGSPAVSVVTHHLVINRAVTRALHNQPLVFVLRLTRRAAALSVSVYSEDDRLPLTSRVVNCATVPAKSHFSFLFYLLCNAHLILTNSPILCPLLYSPLFSCILFSSFLPLLVSEFTLAVLLVVVRL